ncbi:pancreatic triacylglycerol lipase [Papilio machaon]|uniref:pancreatic triacylglycerol lipase n=1 Tax=Papilio machaon TaxID=76193 RepID=UPI001E663209|nr:pancreatic triacylglycerol lipase [Papilio machaon]
MELIVFIVSVIMLCFGNAISVIPGDNSHYIEGVSRYIWMPDGEDVPHLVDLQEEPDMELLTARDSSYNQYWLYTRSNPDSAQIITYEDKESIFNSSYDGNKPIKVIVHGWNNDGNSNVNRMVKTAILETLDANVIVVDWKRLASSNYVSATNGIPDVGEHLGYFLTWLIESAGGEWNKVHLIGFSLGAHAVGIAGRTAGGKPARVTALDPAGPLWVGNPQALNTSSAHYVEAIHTDGGFLGMSEALAHGDFFPNSGKHPQPGCWISTCSHSRSYRLFASSIYTDHFVAKRCNDTNEAHNNQCTGSEFNMGNCDITKRGSGMYGLSTERKWPF